LRRIAGRTAILSLAANDRLAPAATATASAAATTTWTTAKPAGTATKSAARATKASVNSGGIGVGINGGSIKTATAELTAPTKATSATASEGLILCESDICVGHIGDGSLDLEVPLGSAPADDVGGAGVELGDFVFELSDFDILLPSDGSRHDGGEKEHDGGVVFRGRFHRLVKAMTPKPPGWFPVFRRAMIYSRRSRWPPEGIACGNRLSVSGVSALGVRVNRRFFVADVPLVRPKIFARDFPVCGTSPPGNQPIANA
jgi:hypothetical protein